MIIEIIKGTPMWVYLLFALLIYKGVIATKPKTVKLSKLFIMPVVFLYLMGRKMSYNPTYFLIFLVVGCFIGLLIYKNVKIKADKEQKIIQLPGSIVPIILIIIAFAKGYFIGYTTAVHPEIAKTVCFTIGVAIASGILSGIFIGRTAIYLYKYSKVEHEALTISASRKD